MKVSKIPTRIILEVKSKSKLKAVYSLFTIRIQRHEPTKWFSKTAKRIRNVRWNHWFNRLGVFIVRGLSASAKERYQRKAREDLRQLYKIFLSTSISKAIPYSYDLSKSLSLHFRPFVVKVLWMEKTWYVDTITDLFGPWKTKQSSHAMFDEPLNHCLHLFVCL